MQNCTSLAITTAKIPTSAKTPRVITAFTPALSRSESVILKITEVRVVIREDIIFYELYINVLIDGLYLNKK
jgi:hypothetical protein